MNILFVKKKFSSPLAITLILTSLLVLRVFLYVDKWGAVEFDSGWYIGTALNFGKNGKYASLLSSSNSTTPGIVGGIHGRPLVQDEQGSNYFSAGVTVGPGYIIPQGLIFSIFGNGEWTRRAYPFLIFILLMGTTTYLVTLWGGLFSALLYTSFYYFLVRFIIQFSFEAYSEHIAVFYSLWGYLFLCPKLITPQKLLRGPHNIFLSIISGCFFGFAYLTKSLSLLLIPPLILLLGIEGLEFLYKDPSRRFYYLKRWGGWLGGFVFVLIFWESYRFLSLFLMYGLDAWKANNLDAAIVFKSAGSGLNQDFNFSFMNFWDKLNFWKRLGLPQGNFINFIFFLCPILVFLPNLDKKIPKKEMLLFCIIPWALLLWFGIFNTTGWPRHAWIGAFFIPMSISMGLGILWRWDPPWSGRLWASYLLIGLILQGFTPWQSKVFFNADFFLSDRDRDLWNLQRGFNSLPATPLFNKSEQDEFIKFSKNLFSPNDYLYFEGWYMVAEASALLEKPLHTLGKYLEYKKSPNSSHYLIMGPYQISQHAPYKIAAPNYITDTTSKYCSKVLFQNPSYLVCSVKDFF